MVIGVSIIRNSSRHFSLREDLKELVMQPLSKGSVLSCEFYYLLSNDASPEGTCWRYLGGSKERHIIYQLLINLSYLEILSLDLHLAVQVLLYNLFELLSIVSIEQPR